ncbi:MAG: EscU/YscU/HrcU family type III secretion system export apparatus switch protein [Bdellovibrionales bacterium]|nr:EscU/YscU/HrcU family type III secretion system export apparatus switch protein [Bdellovibrionales bacterium]
MQKTRNRKQAAALQYNSAESLPTVLVKGSGLLADLIESLAKENGIPIAEESELLPLLMTTSNDSSVPKESFKILAEIFSFLYLADQQWRGDHPHLQPLIDAPTSPLEDSSGEFQ